MNTPKHCPEPNGEEPTATDQAISSVVDGLATEDERALVEGDPDLMIRLESFRAVKTLLTAELTPPSDEVRDATISMVLDSVVTDTAAERVIQDGSRSPVSSVPPVPSVSSVDQLEMARNRREGAEWKQSRRLLVAAAILVVLAVPALIAIVAQTTNHGTSNNVALVEASNSSEKSADSSPEQFDAVGGQSDQSVPAAMPRDAASGINNESSATESSTTAGSDSADAPDTGASVGVGAGSIVELGVITTPDELREKVNAVMVTVPTYDAAETTPSVIPSTTTTVAISETPESCISMAQTSIGVGTSLQPVLIANATYVGIASQVLVFVTNSETIAVVAGQNEGSDCQILVTVKL